MQNVGNRNLKNSKYKSLSKIKDIFCIFLIVDNLDFAQKYFMIYVTQKHDVYNIVVYMY